jgi:hypothetical protein
MTEMLRAAARKPRTAIMVERRSVQWTAVGAVTEGCATAPTRALLTERCVERCTMTNRDIGALHL